MSFIKGRVRRLEERSIGGRCRGCKLPPDGPRQIALERIPEDAEENCPECGLPLWTVIKVVYQDAACSRDVGEGGR
jgi:hypothetical protein